MLAAEFFEQISVESTRTHGHCEIRSDLSSANFNSSVRAERLFAIRYLNVVIKPLCGNLDICLIYYFRSRTFGRTSRPKVKDAFFGSRFRVALLRNLAESNSVTKNRTRGVMSCLRLILIRRNVIRVNTAPSDTEN